MFYLSSLVLYLVQCLCSVFFRNVLCQRWRNKTDIYHKMFTNNDKHKTNFCITALHPISNNPPSEPLMAWWRINVSLYLDNKSFWGQEWIFDLDYGTRFHNFNMYVLDIYHTCITCIQTPGFLFAIHHRSVFIDYMTRADWLYDKIQTILLRFKIWICHLTTHSFVYCKDDSPGNW